ncbi:hypothetical protein LguiA_015590 [Lonicera macranthoides]
MISRAPPSSTTVSEKTWAVWATATNSTSPAKPPSTFLNGHLLHAKYQNSWRNNVRSGDDQGMATTCSQSSLTLLTPLNNNKNKIPTRAGPGAGQAGRPPKAQKRGGIPIYFQLCGRNKMR